LPAAEAAMKMMMMMMMMGRNAIDEQPGDEHH